MLDLNKTPEYLVENKNLWCQRHDFWCFHHCFEKRRFIGANLVLRLLDQLPLV